MRGSRPRNIFFFHIPFRSNLGLNRDLTSNKPTHYGDLGILHKNKKGLTYLSGHYNHLWCFLFSNEDVTLLQGALQNC